MKILHTADWHIGKQLYKHTLDDDIILFFNWMIDYIKEEQIDILLVAGDVFDLANPSHASRKIYYDVLKQLIQLKITVVITGGNHDSITNLEASSQLLSTLNIHVIGGATDHPSDEIVEINKNGEHVIIAAVPYLRDKDVRKGGDFDSDSDRIKLYQQGIIKHYTQLKNLIVDRNKDNSKVIAMGHLYLQSAKLSESERDIQMGNLAGVNASDFENMFDYTALGHIHKPQSFCNGMVRYSGSPISLSFSERKDQKIAIQIEISEGEMKVHPIAIPKNRELKRISGSLDEVKQKLHTLHSNLPLQTYVEIEVVEKNYSITVLDDARNYFANFNAENVKIIKERIRFENSERHLSEKIPNKEIKDLKPIEVFDKRLENEDLTETQIKDLLDCFYQLEELAHQDLLG